MDGNGRWANRHGLPRLEGHRHGSKVARRVVEWAAKYGIRQLSLFAFSTENWARPEPEIKGLMGLLTSLLVSQIPEMKKQGVRLRTIGLLDTLPSRTRNAIEKACKATQGNDRIDLILCLSYGGQQEILEGVRQAAKWAMNEPSPDQALNDLDVEGFRRFLWCGDLEPIDLLIRTGGEKRISNYYLWDAAYAELYFSDKFWPDFTEDDFHAALTDYAGRERRFGKTSDQMTAQEDRS
jgi:undecaprenyl diphosphate synthase